jgi:hypothetical protein
VVAFSWKPLGRWNIMVFEEEDWDEWEEDDEGEEDW